MNRLNIFKISALAIAIMLGLSSFTINNSEETRFFKYQLDNGPVSAKNMALKIHFMKIRLFPTGH